MRLNQLQQITLFLAVGAAALAAGYYTSHVRNAVDTTAGGADRVPALSLPDENGVTRSLDEWAGKALLINFWATWCAPCREEIPELVEAQTRFGDRGVQVIGIAVDRPEPVRRYMADLGFNYPSLVGETAGMDVMATFGNPGSLPFTLAFDRDGALVGSKLGKVSAAEIREFVEAMVPAS